MHAAVNMAMRAARDAAEVLVQAFDRLDRIKVVDAHPDRFLTNVDQVADNTILGQLQKTFPGHRFQSRVSGSSGPDSSDTLWLIDPLLGNRNFASGHSQFAVSIACQKEGKLVHGVMLFPLLRDELWASRGDGAQLNSHRLRVTDAGELAQTLIGLDHRGLGIPEFVGFQQALLDAGALPRMSGDGALDMAYTAAGVLQGGWCGAGEAVSMAAAQLILKEAGGLITGHDGSPDLARASELLFAGPHMVKLLLKLRKTAG